MELCSVVLVLRAVRNADVPASQGKAVHALFLEMVSHLDSRLVDWLHQEPQERPFTVSTLQGHFERVGRGYVAVSGGEKYWLRFTSIEKNLTSVLAELPRFVGSDLRLLDCPFQLLDVIFDAARDAWAGQTGYADMLEFWFNTADHAPADITLEFVSPTTFRFEGYNIPLPQPNLVFLSLARKWNLFSGALEIPENVLALLENNILISQYDLQTHSLFFADYLQVGFKGKCRFSFKQSAPMIPFIAGMLADFAFFAGVGYKTTMGMGQVRTLSSYRS